MAETAQGSLSFDSQDRSDLKRADSEAQELAELIRYHNQKYWVEHKPEISDLAYDRLVERLRALDPDNPVLVELVEDEVRDTAVFPKVRHAVPMLSIDKCFTVDDVIDWATKAGAFRTPAPPDGIVASFKVDGSSCSLIFEHGKLIRAASRGNGVLGDDITRNARTIADIPHMVAAFKGQRVEVRGEIYMTVAAFKAALGKFEELLGEGKAREEERPTNPRNFCAGSIKQKDPAVTRSRNLSFIAHGTVGRLPGTSGRSEVENQQRLAELGFKTAFYKLVTAPEQVGPVVAEIDNERKSLPYETDGVVFIINRLALHAELGSTSHHPRYKLAYKFSRDRGETTVTRILWHTTRSGRVAPAMEVAPIGLGGATVTLCTLHNAKTVKETKLRVGDKVLLEREVIPYFVQKTSPDRGEAVLPKKCGSCGAELSWDETETNLVCRNLGGCPSQLHDYLSYYVSRGVTNMMGLGEKLIAKLIDAGLLKSPADFFRLTEKAVLENVERQGETSARNAIRAIQDRREQSLETFLVSLGIRGLGPAVAARLAEHFGTLEALQAATPDDLTQIEGIAETLAAGIHQGLNDRHKLIDDLLRYVRLTQREKIQGPLTGKSFCLTGHVEFDAAGQHYDSRPAIEELIKAHGGSIKNVSKTLDYLVVGADPGTKVEKARKAGVQLLDAAGLLKLLAGRQP